jgi:glucans biosynthesis protein
MHRRDLILAGLSWPLLAPLGAVLPALAQDRTSNAAATSPFDDETVPGLARALAAVPYQAPDLSLVPSLRKLDYDAYRDLRFNPERALWRGDGLPFQAQFFHRGFLFKQRVDMHVVEDGCARPLVYRPDMFTFGPAATAPTESDLGFAGFRVHGPINNPDYFDEICAFLGASYFRAVARGQVYGLSARGLALRTASVEGEEFPAFKAFWLQRPAKNADSAVVHALLDSPSVAGAFRFVITPGADTTMDVSMRLYPRVTLDQAGIAPLTSMFHFAANDRLGVDDFRPAVHDSDGLAMLTGGGQQVWRPLHNPAALQDSGFEDENPRGFGLMQRKRAFEDYADSEAHYQRRPSAWVEPMGDWGRGRVHLIEIPTADEYHDNIVAYWRPAAPLAAAREHRFDYRLHWCDMHRWKPQLATVTDTMIGAAMKPEHATTNHRQVVIDFAGDALQGQGEGALRADVWANGGTLLNPVAHPLPATGGWRIGFELDTGASPTVELHARLLQDGQPVSETWLYRWTA